MYLNNKTIYQITQKMMSNKKPCCKVCQDAGKPEEVYTSHWVKDLTGKTVCPTLLNVECRFCHKLGHTTKYCKELEQENKEKMRAEKKLKYQKHTTTAAVQKPVVQKKKNTANVFDVFCEDDESDQDDQKCLVDSASACMKTHVEVVNSWASIAAKPKEQKPVALPPTQKTGLVLVSDFVKQQPPQEAKPAPWSRNYVAKKSWADLSDSEDEYEYKHNKKDDDDDDYLPEVKFVDYEVDPWTTPILTNEDLSCMVNMNEYDDMNDIDMYDYTW